MGFLLSNKKGAAAFVRQLLPVQLSFFRELILAYAADGANPVFGQIFEFGARSDVVFRIAGSFIIDITANFANVFFHYLFPLKVFVLLVRIIPESSPECNRFS
jgi:hypothetical protein